jgi:gas vesicle protein
MKVSKWTAVAAFVCGASLGVLAGMFLAPKSGEEMREDFTDQLHEGAKRVRAATKSVKRQAHEIADQVQQAASDMAEAGLRAARKINPS